MKKFPFLVLIVASCFLLVAYWKNSLSTKTTASNIQGSSGIDKVRTFSKMFTLFNGGSPHLTAEWVGNTEVFYDDTGKKTGGETYDAKGRLIEQFTYDASGNKASNVQTFDAEGRPLNLGSGVNSMTFRYGGDYVDNLRQYTKLYIIAPALYGGHEVLSKEWQGNKYMEYYYTYNKLDGSGNLIPDDVFTTRYEGIKYSADGVRAYSKAYASATNQKEYLSSEWNGDTVTNYLPDGTKIEDMTYDDKDRLVKFVVYGSGASTTTYTYQ